MRSSAASRVGCTTSTAGQAGVGGTAGIRQASTGRQRIPAIAGMSFWVACRYARSAPGAPPSVPARFARRPRPAPAFNVLLVRVAGYVRVGL